MNSLNFQALGRVVVKRARRSCLSKTRFSILEYFDDYCKRNRLDPKRVEPDFIEGMRQMHDGPEDIEVTK